MRKFFGRLWDWFHRWILWGPDDSVPEWQPGYDKNSDLTWVEAMQAEIAASEENIQKTKEESPPPLEVETEYTFENEPLTAEEEAILNALPKPGSQDPRELSLEEFAKARYYAFVGDGIWVGPFVVKDGDFKIIWEPTFLACL